MEEVISKIENIAQNGLFNHGAGARRKTLLYPGNY
jgi:hypothetical protein